MVGKTVGLIIKYWSLHGLDLNQHKRRRSSKELKEESMGEIDACWKSSKGAYQDISPIHPFKEPILQLLQLREKAMRGCIISNKLNNLHSLRSKYGRELNKMNRGDKSSLQKTKLCVPQILITTLAEFSFRRQSFKEKKSTTKNDIDQPQSQLGRFPYSLKFILLPAICRRIRGFKKDNRLKQSKRKKKT